MSWQDTVWNRLNNIMITNVFSWNDILPKTHIGYAIEPSISIDILMQFIKTLKFIFREQPQ